MDGVSILMPVKNAEKFLGACLESVQAQSYAHLQMIVVDDHSTDLSAAIIENYRQNDERIQLLKNDGTGIVDALRTALAVAKYPLISRMDADDIMPPHKLEELRRILIEDNADVATGLVKYFSDSELGDGFLRYEQWLNTVITDGIFKQQIYKECVVPSPCWMMRRTTLEQIGGFPLDTYPEDYDLTFRMVHSGLKISGSNQVCHLWRDHGARASRNDDNYSDNRFLDLKMKYFVQYEVNEGSRVVLYGAGKKAKLIAKDLIEKVVPFKWLTDNPNKIGHNIYGAELQSGITFQAANSKVILAIANPTEQTDVIKTLSAKGATVEQLFPFC